MDIMINRSSEAETAARAIAKGANARRETFTEEVDAKTAASDKGVGQGTARRIAETQERMEANMNGLLAEQKVESGALLKELEDSYNQRHEGHAEALFQKMIKG